MSLKLFNFLILILLISCKKSTSLSVTNNYSEEEVDSIAKRYDKLSVYFYQPSEIHRKYKDSAILMQPEKVNYIQRLSYSHKKVGDHIKAMEILNKAVAIDTTQGRTNALEYKVWSLLYFYRDYEGTIKDANLVEKISGVKYTACWGEPCGMLKGQALYKLGRYDEAIKAFETVNEEEEKRNLQPEGNDLIFFYLGRCYAEKKEYKNALIHFNKSLKAAYDLFPEAYYQIGLIYKEQNNQKEAIKYFEKAFELKKYKLQEPYIERFDEVFPYMIEYQLNNLKK